MEKEEQKNPTVSRRKEIIRIRPEINEKEMKETIVMINKTKSWFFEKINKIEKPLALKIDTGALACTQLSGLCFPVALKGD